MYFYCISKIYTYSSLEDIVSNPNMEINSKEKRKKGKFFFSLGKKTHTQNWFCSNFPFWQNTKNYDEGVFNSDHRKSINI